MSATPTRSIDFVPARPAARLELHVRIPAVPIGGTASLPTNDPTAEETRGMKVLNGILDKRSRSAWGRRAGRRGPNRSLLFSAIVVVLSGFALILGMTNDGNPKVDSNETDVFANDDFESESTMRPVAPKITPLSPSVAESRVETADGPPPGSAVQAAVYHTTEQMTARTAWLDGTIVPEETREP